MPKEVDLGGSSSTTLHSTMLLVAGPRKMPPELSSSPVGEKMTQVEEAMFRVLWLTELAYLI